MKAAAVRIGVFHLLADENEKLNHWDDAVAAVTRVSMQKLVLI